MTVVTYRLAYLPDHVDLCADCASDAIADSDIMGTIGPVEHGMHDGTCDQCEEVML